MRIKVVSNPKICGGIELVNAETGERIEGVTSLSMHCTPESGTNLTIWMHDIDCDIEHEAYIHTGKNLVPRGTDESHTCLCACH